MGKGLIVACVLLTLGACQTSGGSFCRVMTAPDGKPLLRPTKADVAAVSDRLARELVTVLETGEKLGCWKKP